MAAVPLPWCASMSTIADPLGAAGAEGLGRDGRVVEVAGAAVPGRGGVVAGRPGEGVRERGTLADEGGRGGRAVDGGEDRGERSGTDERHRVVGEAAGVGVDRDGLADGQSGRHRRRREVVRDDPLLADEVGVRARGPAVGGGAEELDELGVVHGVERRAPGRGRHLDEPEAGGVERLEDRVDPRGGLGADRRDADPDLVPRVVETGVGRPQHRDVVLTHDSVSNVRQDERHASCPRPRHRDRRAADRPHQLGAGRRGGRPRPHDAHPARPRGPA